MKKRKLFLLVAILFSMNGHAAEKSVCKSISTMSSEQKDVLNISYREGEKHNLGYTIAAIGWQESFNGLYAVKFDEKSAGVHHINLKSALKRLKMKNTILNRSKVATKLISDPSYSAQMAIREFKYWKSQGRNWRESIQSYNSGWSIYDKDSLNYLSFIRKKVKTLKECESHWLKPY